VDDTEITLWVLEVLHQLVKNKNTKAHGDALLGSRLLCLIQGWDGKEEGLGLLSISKTDPFEQVGSHDGILYIHLPHSCCRLS